MLIDVSKVSFTLDDNECETGVAYKWFPWKPCERWPHQFFLSYLPSLGDKNSPLLFKFSGRNEKLIFFAFALDLPSVSGHSILGIQPGKMKFATHKQNNNHSISLVWFSWGGGGVLHFLTLSKKLVKSQRPNFWGGGLCVDLISLREETTVKTLHSLCTKNECKKCTLPQTGTSSTLPPSSPPPPPTWNENLQIWNFHVKLDFRLQSETLTLPPDFKVQLYPPPHPFSQKWNLCIFRTFKLSTDTSSPRRDLKV